MAKIFLKQRVLNLDKKTQNDLLKKTLRVISHPDLSFAFDQTAIAEAPIYGIVKNGNVSDLSCKTAVHHRKVANHY